MEHFLELLIISNQSPVLRHHTLEEVGLDLRIEPRFFHRLSEKNAVIGRRRLTQWRRRL